ncbi:MAG: cation:proton antiporter [Chthoniobacterales bacterium]
MEELILDITLCIIAAWCLGVIAQFIKQPVILAYLVGGFLLGPACLGWVHSQESISTISELGLIFLLFMIGLEIDLKKILSAGSSITVTALCQIVGGTLIGVVFFRLCGFPLGDGKWDALYLGIAATLSSTVIIVKVLYDKRELDTFPGRVTLGILVLQDLFAILFLALQPNLANLAPGILFLSLGRVLLLVVSALLVSRFVLPPLFRSIARLPELVLVGAIAWCFGMGEFAERLHLSREMGALVAGVSLSTFPYALDVTAKITTLRDFFVTLFFVGLGMAIPMPTVGLLGSAILFAAFTVVCTFLTTFIPMYAMRQGLRASLLPAINLSQISEFSLVILALGATAMHFGNQQTKGLVSLAFVILATVSCLAMVSSDPLIRRLIPWLKKCGLQDLDHENVDLADAHGEGHGSGAEILLLGFFRTASSLLEELQRHSPDLIEKVAVVDFSPVVFSGLRQRGVKIIYGDISQQDTLRHAGIEYAKVLVCTVPQSLLKGTTNIKLVQQLRALNTTAQIIAPAEVLTDIPLLYEAGANYVFVGRLNEATDLTAAIRAATEGLLDQKKDHIDHLLKDRKEILA